MNLAWETSDFIEQSLMAPDAYNFVINADSVHMYSYEPGFVFEIRVCSLQLMNMGKTFCC